MDFLDEAYEEMGEWGTYTKNQNQAMSETIEEEKGIMLELKRNSDHHREKYLKLSILSNHLINQIPRSLKVAEAMTGVLKPPKEIFNFIKLCRYMVDEFRDRTKIHCKIISL